MCVPKACQVLFPGRFHGDKGAHGAGSRATHRLPSGLLGPAAAPITAGPILSLSGVLAAVAAGILQA